MSNPYLLDRPAVISFSGGRTSGYMLWHVLQAFGGTLPEDVLVCFQNTGKEREETLDFVRECSMRWGVPITWLEYRRTDDKPAFEVVTFETASRKGEPFAALIESRKFLPNPVARICTIELKILTRNRYLSAIGFPEEFTSVIGLRADEPRRVSRIRNQRESYTNVCPLADAGVTLPTITAWWAKQPFTLHLMPHESNCDLCFLKGAGKIVEILERRPELAAWWVEQEKARNASFRSDRPRYENLLRMVSEQGRFDFGGGEIEDCHCTD